MYAINSKCGIYIIKSSIYNQDNGLTQWVYAECQFGITHKVGLNRIKRDNYCNCYYKGQFKNIVNKLYQMVRRCYRPDFEYYNDYGGRGITVCDEWNIDINTSAKSNFVNWALNNGYKPGLTIERKDNDGNYEPNNCCWIPQGDQLKNRRGNWMIEINGVTKCAEDWSRDPNCSVTGAAIIIRLENGWSNEESVFTPSHHKRKNIQG